MNRSTTPVIVEPVGPEEWARVRAVRLASLRQDPQSFYKRWSEEVGLAETDWRSRLASAHTWLAVRDGADVGMVTSSPDRGDPNAAHLSGLWIALRGRRRGAAVSLSQAVIAHARSSGFERVVLWVASANDGADRLYAGLGFTPTGRTDTFQPPRDTYTEWALELLR